MKRNARIIGSLGIAAAISMGVFAVTPVSAEDLIPLDYKNSSSSSDVTVKVKVVGETPTINIAKPLDGSEIIGLEAAVSVDYTNATQLHYELVYIDDDGVKTSYDLPLKSVATEGVADGTHKFNIDARNYGGQYGTYILRSTADGAGNASDSVSFKLVSFEFDVKGKEENTYNPIITFKKNPIVRKTLVQVFDNEGNAIFDEPIEVTLNEDEDTDVTLPFAMYGLEEGDYKIVATPYDGDGNIVDENKTRNVHYTPAPAPEVPDTGSILGALGLSRSDLVSTGLALLFVTAFFGILIIAKKSKKSSRR